MLQNILSILQKSVAAAWSPSQLFASGEQGVWYDPSDLTTMFTGLGNNGSSPLQPIGTVADQPIRSILDKSKGLLPTGSELISNGDFSGGTTGWTSVVTASVAVVSGELNITTSSAYGRAGQAITTVAGLAYTCTCTYRRISGTGTVYVEANTLINGGVALGNTPQSSSSSATTTTFTFIAQGTSTTIFAIATGSGDVIGLDNVSVKLLTGTPAVAPNDAARPLLSARVNLLVGTATLSTQSVTVVAAPHTIQFTGGGTVTASGAYSGALTSGQTFTTTAGSLTLTVSGTVTNAQLQIGPTATTYQDVVTASNYTATGFPAYLKFDGVNSKLATNSIAFTTDEMSNFVGIFKFGSATVQISYETSNEAAGNNGTFNLVADTLTTYAVAARGTTARVVTGTITSVTPKVVTTLIDISAPSQVLRIDTVATTSTLSLGTGNFGNWPLYIGMRNPNVFPFTGNLYGVIIRNASTSGATLTSAEQWVAAKTGVTLP